MVSLGLGLLVAPSVALNVAALYQVLMNGLIAKDPLGLRLTSGKVRHWFHSILLRCSFRIVESIVFYERGTKQNIVRDEEIATYLSWLWQ